MSVNNNDMVIVKLDSNSVSVGDVLASVAVSPSGVLLVPKDSIVSERIIQLLRHNDAKVMVWRSHSNSGNHINIMSDNSACLSDSIKEYVLLCMKSMYEPNKSSSEIVSIAKNISALLLNEVLKKSYDYISTEPDLLKVSDDYTFKHSVDVAIMGTVLGKAMGLSDRYLSDIMIAGILHDFGKIDIPTNVLEKSGKLTDEEFNMMKNHPRYGYLRLKDDDSLSELAKQGILTHHEKFSGHGYPLGLSGERIPMIGRILCVVDVYDALTTDRPYHPAKSPAEAYDMMLNMEGQFDPDIFQIFSQVVLLKDDE